MSGLRSAALFLCAVTALPLLAACSKDPPAGAAKPDSTTAAAPPETSATAAPSPIATAAPTVAPTTTASAAAPPSNIVRSGRPTLIEWCKAPVADITDSTHEDGDAIEPCQMIEVREWVMVWCPRNGRRVGGKNLGAYDRALPGGGSMATEAELEAAGVPTPDAVVISLRPGTKAKPAFTYRPQNHPEWIKDETFTIELPESADGLDDRLFNGGRWPTFRPRDSTSNCEQMEAELQAEAKRKADEKAASEAKEDAKILPDVEGLSAAPADEAFDKVKEVVVTGSGALGCKTKILESWFWMRCEGKVKFTGIEIEKGKRQTQTNASVEGGVGKVLVPYVEETNLRAKLAYEGGEKWLKLRWPKGKQPFQVGKVEDTR